MIDHFKYLKSVAKSVPKMTIPSPTALHYRGGRQAIEKSVYPEMEPFFADLGRAYGKAVRAFGEAGCTYLQLDEVFVAYLCDEAQREYLRGRGDDPDRLLHVYADLVNAACAGRTPGMTISMHLCRGNFRSTWMAQGGYERVADILFNQMGVDAYFMEYDTDRAGGFEPLRFLPKGKQVVLGVMTSKTGELESKDQLKRRIDEAAKFAPSTSSACRRNAASPAPRRATCWPRTSSGPSSGAAWRSRGKSGVRVAMLISFGGLPGTGKTTVARALARRLGAVHVRLDTIEQAMRSCDVLKADVGPAGYAVAYGVAEDNLRIGRIVVADTVNPVQATRDAWLDVARRAGVRRRARSK